MFLAGKESAASANNAICEHVRTEYAFKLCLAVVRGFIKIIRRTFLVKLCLDVTKAPCKDTLSALSAQNRGQRPAKGKVSPSVFFWSYLRYLWKFCIHKDEVKCVK